MRLLALVEHADHVCYRYRIRAFEPALASRGWMVTALPLPRTARGFVRVCRQVARSDVVVLQRRLLPGWKLSVLRRLARVLVYDVDDAVFFRDSNSRRPPASRRRQRRFRATVRAADAVLAGNSWLASEAAKYADPGRIHVLPTCVDPHRDPVARRARQDAGLRIAWIGSRSTLPSLGDLAGALAEASRVRPGLELHVICDKAPRLPGTRVVLHPWESRTEAADLAECDVGLSWLPRHPWSLGKCGLKVLQYMAAGLPVVANRFGVHEHLVAHERTGVLVANPRECVQALGRLAASPGLRERWGRCARERAQADFSVEHWSPRFVRLLERLVGRAGGAMGAMLSCRPVEPLTRIPGTVKAGRPEPSQDPWPACEHGE